MRVSIFAGDIVDAQADAICTSTNPRLSLVMGTGASVRDRAGFSVLRECEAIVAEFGLDGALPPGSAHLTSAGDLPHKAIIHCVASDTTHRSRDEIVHRCVVNALARADAVACRSVAMPLFATGHAHMNWVRSLRVMADAVKGATTAVEHVVFVVYDAGRTEDAREILARFFSGTIDVTSSAPEDRSSSWWSGPG